MPLFYFDFDDDNGSSDRDEDGIEFSSIEAAYVEAFHAAIDMWAEARHQGRDLICKRIIIRNSEGQAVVELPFTEVLGRPEAAQ